MYKPICKGNQLEYGVGNTIIVSGWYPRARLAKQLEDKDYAVIGNLYSSARGIDLLVRNLLANPQYNKVVLLEMTKEDRNAKSVSDLKSFFEVGFLTSDKYTFGSKGVIQKDIPEDDLELLRSQLEVIYCTTVEEVKAAIKKENGEVEERTAKIYPVPENKVTDTLLGSRYGHRVEGKTIAETWIKILHRIRRIGTIRPTGYEGEWQEVIDLTAVVTEEPKELYFPEPNYLPVDRSFLAAYKEQILDDKPYKDGVKYTYGQRLRSWFGKDQIEQVINKLIKEIDSASAVMNLWDSGSGQNVRFGRQPNTSDHEYGGSPCLNHIWVRVVDNQMSMTATFRSNDMFGAWVANAMGLRMLQWYILDEINKRSDYELEIAPLITISQSAHIYDECWSNVKELIENHYLKDELKPNYDSAVGDFIITKRDSYIRVEQANKKGEIVRVYEEKSPLKLIRLISAENPTIEPSHMGYLGFEINKAHTQLNYIQDK